MSAIEKRAAARRPTRLRPGKLFGGDGRFLCDCAIKDRNAAGARVGLFAPQALSDLAQAVVLFDEGEGVRWDAELVWSRQNEAGLRFAAGGETVGPDERRRFAGRYYALAD